MQMPTGAAPDKERTDLNYEILTKVMRELALQAGQAIMDIYAQDDLGVETKGDNSPVTRADTAADAIIFDGLRAAFPDITIVTEEQAQSHSLTADRFLIVDPLDGTKDFIQRRGQFTVNIALVEQGVPTRGIVYAPAVGRLFYTDATGQSIEETGDYSLDTFGEMVPISVRVPDNNALAVVASKSHRDAATDAYIQKYNVAEMTPAGSSLKFCLVATGEADLYPRLGRTMEWDTAAGQAVLQGAGGHVVRFDDHTPFRYGKPDYENTFFIAYAPGVQLVT
jgi:3'(2'), 5'-bisphosphate nucleotidase